MLDYHCSHAHNPSNKIHLSAQLKLDDCGWWPFVNGKVRRYGAIGQLRDRVRCYKHTIIWPTGGSLSRWDWKRAILALWTMTVKFHRQVTWVGYRSLISKSHPFLILQMIVFAVGFNNFESKEHGKFFVTYIYRGTRASFDLDSDLV
jgi:hypothetical protein